MYPTCYVATGGIHKTLSITRLPARFAKACQKEKGIIRDEFTQITISPATLARLLAQRRLHGKRRCGLTKPQILVRGYDEPKTPYQRLRERPTLAPFFKPSRIAYGY